MIYFIKSEDGPIKIGYTISIEKRISSLQTGNSKKLVVLATISGSRNFERKIHNKFHHFKLNGEWFKPEKELLDFIEELKSSGIPEEETRKIVVLPKLEKQMCIFGENIKLARLRRNFSSSLLAERAGISRPTLYAIEQGSSGVSFGNIANVLFALGLSEDITKLALDDTLGRKLQDIGLTVKKRASKISKLT